MKREIKFRAWIDNKMLEWENLLTNSLWIFNNASGMWIFMQFTGLLDKVGKEIYEGDIVLKHDGKTKAKVLYGTDRFYLEPVWYGEAEDGAFQAVKVIGNIYENPELLP